jgi:parallel beta-helix repeat protein/predicted outer membrane repeat protein
MKTAILLFAVLSVPTLAYSAIIYVPDDFPTIQEAIDAAVNGDRVIVKPGTYVENIDFLGKAITVKSSQGAPATKIEPRKYGSVVTFSNNEGLDSILDGFTIQNGYADGGGGIYCWSSSPLVINNIITHNMTEGFYMGGGIYCHDSSMVIMNNTISENSAANTFYCWGGGIGCHESSPIITGNIITGNTAKEGGGGIYCTNASPTIEYNLISGNSTEYNGGGGILCRKLSSPVIAHNTISNNQASGFWGSGGGIDCDSTSAVIEKNLIKGNTACFGGGISCLDNSPSIISNNIISGNYASSDGGGIAVYDSAPRITNNLIAGNEAAILGGGLGFCGASPSLVNNTIMENAANEKGGGICCWYSAFPIMANNIHWDNAAPTGKEICVNHYSIYPSTLTISYSNVDGGLLSVHVDEDCTLEWGSGMIDADPLFLGAASGDFHLSFDSPCRDAGDNTVVTGVQDFEGDPRIAWSGTVDMGADEFHTHLYVTGDQTPSGSIEGKLVGLPGTSPVGLFFGSGVLDPPLPTAWGDFHLQAPWRLISMAPIPGNGVLVLPATIPATPPAPYDLPMQALIGLELDSLSNLYMLEVR